MNWLKNFERVQEIQQQMLWPPVTELDQKAYIPEVSIGTVNYPTFWGSVFVQ